MTMKSFLKMRVSKKLKRVDGTVKSSTDTGKTLRRRKVLTKAVKKQVTKHIRELNPTNISLLSYRYISTCKWHRRSRALKTIQFIDSCDLSLTPKLYNIISALA